MCDLEKEVKELSKKFETEKKNNKPAQLDIEKAKRILDKM